MWNLILKQVAKRLFPRTPFESLSRAQLQQITSETTKIMNRTKGQTAEIKDFPRGGIHNVPVNQQFTSPGSRQLFEVLDDDAYRGLQADTFRRLIANTDDDVKAFGKRIIENKQDVKFEKLTKDQRKGIFDMIDDRLKMGNRKFMEKYDPMFPPEDFASGGIARVGFAGGLLAKLYKGVKGLQHGAIERKLRKQYIETGMDKFKAYNKAMDDASDVVNQKKLEIVENKMNKVNVNSDDYVDLIDEHIRLTDRETYKDIKRWKNTRPDLADKTRALYFPDWAKTRYGEDYQGVLNKRQASALKEQSDEINRMYPDKSDTDILVDEIDEMNKANIDEIIEGRKKNASGGIARVGMFGGGPIVKGGNWLIKSLLDTRQKIKTMNMSPGQLKYYLNQIDDQIKNIKAGGAIPEEVIQTIRKDPKFRSVSQTRSTDPDLREMEEVLLEYGEKHASGGIAGELHLHRPGYSNGKKVDLDALVDKALSKGDPHWKIKRDYIFDESGNIIGKKDKSGFRAGPRMPTSEIKGPTEAQQKVIETLGKIKFAFDQANLPTDQKRKAWNKLGIEFGISGEELELIAAGKKKLKLEHLPLWQIDDSLLLDATKDLKISDNIKANINLTANVDGNVEKNIKLVTKNLDVTVNTGEWETKGLPLQIKGQDGKITSVGATTSGDKWSIDADLLINRPNEKGSSVDLSKIDMNDLFIRRLIGYHFGPNVELNDLNSDEKSKILKLAATYTTGSGLNIKPNLSYEIDGGITSTGISLNKPSKFETVEGETFRTTPEYNLGLGNNLISGTVTGADTNSLLKGVNIGGTYNLNDNNLRLNIDKGNWGLEHGPNWSGITYKKTIGDGEPTSWEDLGYKEGDSYRVQNVKTHLNPEQLELLETAEFLENYMNKDKRYAKGGLAKVLGV